MSSRTHWLWPLAVISLLALAAAPAPKKSVIDPAEADADFAYQGEYVGEIDAPDGKTTYGAQVIALGGGKFRAIGYPGGLPGDGWRKDAGTVESDGQITDGVALFIDAGVIVKVKDGVLTVTDNNGNPMGTMKRTVRKSPTLGKQPPEGAIVLFDGKSGDQFRNAKLTKDGLLIANNEFSNKTFQSCTLHVEFFLPYEPRERGQGRANSGVYLQGRYEVQVLDSFGLEGKDNECGGIYTIASPAVNMCLPPLQWQTYDIDYTAATYEGGKKTVNARMTVRHNGVLIHDNVEITKGTTAAPIREGAAPGPIYLQNHGHDVLFRNIWIVEKK